MNSMDHLHAAVAAGDADRLAAAVQPGQSYGTLLHQAVGFSDEKAALAMSRILLAAGADVHAVAEKGWTPLHVAARRGHLGLVQLLLIHGASPEAKADDGKTALSLVTADENLPVYRLLEGWG